MTHHRVRPLSVLPRTHIPSFPISQEYQLLRILDMSEVHTVASVAMKRNENAFGIVTPKRTYYVKASSNSEMLSWVEHMMNVKTQLQMRSTLTQEMAATDISDVQANTSTPAKVGRTQSSRERSPNVSESSEGGRASPSQPMSITIPGQGTYVSPAQPRPIPSPGGLAIPIKNGSSKTVTNFSPSQASSQAFSPLTSTTTSGGSGGSDNGAEQYGLSYQSSAGFSASSSPPRGAASELSPTSSNNNLSHSPQSTGEMSDRSRRGVGPRRNSSARNRSRGEGSSEGAAGDRSVSPTKRNPKSSGGSQGYFGSGGGGGPSATPGAGGALSSSDEEDDGDGEGEDWDEDEVADQAMPLPGLIPGSTSATQQTSSQQHSQAQQAQGQSIQSNNAPLRLVVQPPAQLKDPSKVIMQGYLMKQSNRRKHWRKRWFVLNGMNLTYSRSNMDSKNERQIPLSSILDAIEYTSKKQPIGTQSSSLSPGLASPSATNQSFNFAHLDDNTAERPSEREPSSGAEGNATGEEGTSNSGVQHPPPQSKPERRTSMVAAAASNIGERLGSVTSNAQSSSGVGSSTSPTLGGTSPLPGQIPKKKKENCFKIITPKRTFVVCAPTEEEEIKWLGAIQALLTRSRGSTTSTIATPTNQTTGFTLALTPSNGGMNHPSINDPAQSKSNNLTLQSSPTQMNFISNGADEHRSTHHV